MTALRQRMIQDMQLRRLAKTTQRSYVHYVAEYAKYIGLGPEQLDLEAVRQYTLYLVDERKLAPETINASTAAIKFVYLQTLEMPWRDEDFPPRQPVPAKVPTILSPQEIGVFFDAIAGVKNRAVVALCYGAGLRISEAVAVKVGDIDSARRLIRIPEGKGNRPRNAMLSPRVLELLRAYYRMVRPQGEWLFPSWGKGKHLSPATVQQACRDAAYQAGFSKHVTPHTLRHCFATHLLENGEDIRVIQALLGHRRIDTTAGYTAVTPARLAKAKPPLDSLLGPSSNPTTKKRGRPKKQA